jgi:hypothetical protein
MTVDLLNSSGALQSYPTNGRIQNSNGGDPTGPITDVIIVFGGWGSDQAGQPLPQNPNPPTGASRLVDRLSKIETIPFHTTVLEAYQGALFKTTGTDDAEQVLKDNFHPLGRWIIYGYSAGGVSALSLAWTVWNEMRIYDFSSKSLSGQYISADATNKRRLGVPRIDLLITVDVAFGPVSNPHFLAVPRNVPPCVRKNLNFFQRFPASSVESHGSPAFAVDGDATDLDNQDLSERYRQDPGHAHGRISHDTIEDVIQAVRGTLA